MLPLGDGAIIASDGQISLLFDAFDSAVSSVSSRRSACRMAQNQFIGDYRRLWLGQIEPGHAILEPQDHSLSVVIGPAPRPSGTTVPDQGKHLAIPRTFPLPRDDAAYS
jgi:hypothetical protein